MIREYKRRWRVRSSRRELWVGFFMWENPVRQFWRWLTSPGHNYYHYSRPFGVRLRTIHGFHHVCYCRTGTTTEFNVEFFGSAVRCSLSRDITPRPCSCDKIGWLLSPDCHADEIDEYGADKLRAEFPGVEPLGRHR